MGGQWASLGDPLSAKQGACGRGDTASQHFSGSGQVQLTLSQEQAQSTGKAGPATARAESMGMAGPATAESTGMAGLATAKSTGMAGLATAGAESMGLAGPATVGAGWHCVHSEARRME